MCCTISDKLEKFFRKLFKSDDESSTSSAKWNKNPLSVAKDLEEDCHSGQKFDPSDPSSQNIFFSRDVKAIKYKEIKRATENFTRGSLLGEGGFGPVYKGRIHEKNLTATKSGSGIDVAVKTLNNEGCQGHKEWVDEINYLSRLRDHPNVVKIIGYSFHQEKRIVVYEFVRRGSLETHLFSRRAPVLTWATRIKVAVGAARALAFLHDREIPIIHRNIKCGDILLDDDFNTKLSGFGLARDGPTHVSTRVMGTSGYAAPEHIATGHLTTRCDVYGFGIVLLELISGLKVIDKTRAHLAKRYLRNKAILPSIMDSRLEGEYPIEEAFEVAKIALQCVSAYPRIRPRMAEVVAALEQLSSEM